MEDRTYKVDFDAIKTLDDMVKILRLLEPIEITIPKNRSIEGIEYLLKQKED